jgi:hypothetical protein
MSTRLAGARKIRPNPHRSSPLSFMLGSRTTASHSGLTEGECVEGDLMRLRRHDVSLRELDGETVLLDLATSRYLVVNGSGTVLLGQLDEGSSRAGLVAALVDEFAVDEGTAGRDVDAFVDALRELGLLDDAENV